jgi:hypothetical protein
LCLQGLLLRVLLLLRGLLRAWWCDVAAADRAGLLSPLLLWMLAKLDS